jgi:hypothetical protein
MTVTYRIDSNPVSYETVNNIMSIEVGNSFVNIVNKDGKKTKVNFNNLLLIESGESDEE